MITRDGQGSTDLATESNQLLEQGSRNIRYKIIGPSLTGRLPYLGFSMRPNVLQGVSKYDDSLQAGTTGGPVKEPTLELVLIQLTKLLIHHLYI